MIKFILVTSMILLSPLLSSTYIDKDVLINEIQRLYELQCKEMYFVHDEILLMENDYEPSVSEKNTWLHCSYLSGRLHTYKHVLKLIDEYSTCPEK